MQKHIDTFMNLTYVEEGGLYVWEEGTILNQPDLYDSCKGEIMRYANGIIETR